MVTRPLWRSEAAISGPCRLQVDYSQAKVEGETDFLGLS